MRVTGIDHVQLAMPAGQEELAREFYSRTLGIPEVPKPPADGVPGSFRVHVSDPFGNRIELIEAR